MGNSIIIKILFYVNPYSCIKCYKAIRPYFMKVFWNLSILLSSYLNSIKILASSNAALILLGRTSDLKNSSKMKMFRILSLIRFDCYYVFYFRFDSGLLIANPSSVKKVCWKEE